MSGITQTETILAPCRHNLATFSFKLGSVVCSPVHVFFRVQKTKLNGILVKTPIVTQNIILGPCPKRGASRSVKGDDSRLTLGSRYMRIDPTTAVNCESVS